MFKNVMETVTNIKGYCFVDEDGEEVRASIPRDYGGSLQLVHISTDSEDSGKITVYHKDIPKLIKVLEAAYTHTVHGQTNGF